MQYCAYLKKHKHTLEAKTLVSKPSHILEAFSVWYRKVHLWVCDVVFRSAALRRSVRTSVWSNGRKGELQQNHENPLTLIFWGHLKCVSSHQDVCSSPVPYTSSSGFQTSGSGSSSAPLRASSLLLYLLFLSTLPTITTLDLWLRLHSAVTARNIRVGTRGARKCPPSPGPERHGPIPTQPSLELWNSWSSLPLLLLRMIARS